MTPFVGRLLSAASWLVPVALLMYYGFKLRNWRLALGGIPPLYVALTYVWLAHRTVAHAGDVDIILTWFQIGQIQMGLTLGLVIYFLGRSPKRDAD